MVEKKHIIIVSVYFPPIISVASNRILAFAKYLDASKYNITVVCLQSANLKNEITLPGVKIIYVPNKQFIQRAGFSKKYPFIIHKLRAAWNTLLNSFGFNDNLSWEKNVFQIIGRTISIPENTVIISSYPTSSPTIVAAKIKQKYPALKWIADLRDGVSNNSSKTSFWNQQQKKQLEEIIINNADAITSVSAPILDFLKSNNSNKDIITHEIRNGFDFESGNNGNFNKIFTISYVGNFYGNRNPGIFYKALEKIIDKGLMIHFKVDFIGVGGAVSIPHTLKNLIHIKDKVPYHEAIEMMRNSDALLLVLPKGENKGVFSGKIFDYLGVMRTVIPLIDSDDVAAQLIRETAAGKVAEWDSVDDAIASILYAYHLWEKKELPPYNQEQIKALHRKFQVEKLGVIIDNLWT
jgi:glycosyltransferase involved in cell wall biosynthesis